MNKIKKTFCKNLYKWQENNFSGTRKELGEFLGVSQGYISNILAARKCPDEEWRRSVTNKIGIDYDTMIGLPEKKETSNQGITTPIPIDEAVQILNEALEETGITINKKQKQAVLKILREELEKSEGKTKDDIKKYLQAFGK